MMAGQVVELQAIDLVLPLKMLSCLCYCDCCCCCVLCTVGQARLDWGTMGVAETEAALRAAGHCSALVKVDGTLTDLFMGHSSWFEYANTDR